jgi:hypothetical protein
MSENNDVPVDTLKDFKKIIVDMTNDILTTFPEQRVSLNSHLVNLLDDSDVEGKSLEFVYTHCKSVYPDKFFDILYQNSTLFTNDKLSAEFLPGIDFKLLWNDTSLSDKTRETIWKYIQLVLFSIISGIKDSESFGSSAKLFEAISEDTFRAKLEETITQMQDVFKGVDNANSNNNNRSNDDSNGNNKKEGINLGDIPNPKDIQDHISDMMGGKLGMLAREIAEETAADLNVSMENSDSVNDVFQKLLKNPTKLMGLIKNVGTKLDNKLKGGDIKESELLKEASEIMQKMKNMPGMSNLQSMMNKMGMGGMAGMAGMAGGGKMNINAMQSNIDQRLKESKNKDRLRAKLAVNNERKMQELELEKQKQKQKECLVFSSGEKVERSTKNDKPLEAIVLPEKKSEKKNKKKK